MTAARSVARSWTPPRRRGRAASTSRSAWSGETAARLVWVRRHGDRQADRVRTDHDRPGRAMWRGRRAVGIGADAGDRPGAATPAEDPRRLGVDEAAGTGRRASRQRRHRRSPRRSPPRPRRGLSVWRAVVDARRRPPARRAADATTSGVPTTAAVDARTAVSADPPDDQDSLRGLAVPEWWPSKAGAAGDLAV